MRFYPKRWITLIGILIMLLTVANQTTAQSPDSDDGTVPDNVGVGYAPGDPPFVENIGFRTEDPGAFLYWPLPSSIPRTAISMIPDSPWTQNFLGIMGCPPYPPMIDDYHWVDPNGNPLYYTGQFATYALPGTTRDRVRFLNTDNTGLLHNFFACYSAASAWSLPDHAGTDIAAANGTNVLATAYSNEVYVVVDSAGDYRIRLRHPNVNGSGQTWYTYYVHLSSSTYPLGVSTPSGGIPRGTVIGGVGRDHLHFQAGIDGNYSNAGARNIWGIDRSPWTGCLWVDSSLCAGTDTTAPTTSASLSGTVGDNGWYRSSVQVTLSAADNAGGSGLKLTQYKIDDGTWRTYSGSFTVSGEGRHTVYYKAQDNAGNWEAEKQVAVKIDSTAPTGSLILAGGATSTPGVVVAISPSASDATSSVAQMRLRDAGGIWSDWRSYATRILWQLPGVTGNTYSVEVQYRDAAGNISGTYNDGIALNLYPNRPASAGYRLQRSTWGVVPWDRQSVNYRLAGTAGQVSLVGKLSSSSYGLTSGFWLGTTPQLRVYLPLVLREAESLN